MGTKYQQKLPCLHVLIHHTLDWNREPISNKTCQLLNSFQFTITKNGSDAWPLTFSYAIHIIFCIMYLEDVPLLTNQLSIRFGLFFHLNRREFQAPRRIKPFWNPWNPRNVLCIYLENPLRGIFLSLARPPLIKGIKANARKPRRTDLRTPNENRTRTSVGDIHTKYTSSSLSAE